MKRVIDGKLYNTDTAKRLCSGGSRGFSSSDFNYFEEILYKTKNGAFFLAGSGGPMTKYAVSTGQNGSMGGSKIIPLSQDDAREWCDQHMSADDYFSHFPTTQEA